LPRRGSPHLYRWGRMSPDTEEIKDPEKFSFLALDKRQNW